MLTLRYAIAVSYYLGFIWPAMLFPLCTFFFNILRQDQADGCKLISHGTLITFQDSNPTGSSALISNTELNNMNFLNSHLPGVKPDLNDMLVNY